MCKVLDSWRGYLQSRSREKNDSKSACLVSASQTSNESPSTSKTIPCCSEVVGVQLSNISCATTDSALPSRTASIALLAADRIRRSCLFFSAAQQLSAVSRCRRSAGLSSAPCLTNLWTWGRGNDHSTFKHNVTWTTLWYKKKCSKAVLVHFMVKWYLFSFGALKRTLFLEA